MVVINFQAMVQQSGFGRVVENMIIVNGAQNRNFAERKMERMNVKHAGIKRTTVTGTRSQVRYKKSNKEQFTV